MLYEYEEFGAKRGLPGDLDDAVFRYCTFDGLDVEGASFDGALLWCTVKRSRFYWGFFNTAALVKVDFEDCTFPGTSFRGCQIIDCTFKRCSFVLDNLGGDCTIDDCTLAATAFDGCRFEHTPGQRQSIFSANTHIWGCSQSACRGIEGLF